ncbi:hypothetical protein [Duganella sp. Root198D2]|uniref:hypothetical protein n=1 Tax=Duganella sp. Root198D2 TaxID=1736489 RepID=UPI0012E3DBA8|nr:hypothetical protein [Duganella sp. Root198D2]
MIDVHNFADQFRAYSWNGKHSLYGYPEDAFPRFEWIVTLEKRFEWLRINCDSEKTASVYLIKEMIQWGGSQNGTLQKFEDGAGEVNLQQLMDQTISNLDDTERAISSALKFPGMGLTYASKLLRFLDPERYGALDNRIRKALLKAEILPEITDSSNPNMISGYVKFMNIVEGIRSQLNTQAISRPQCHLPAGTSSSQWRAADIEMALFSGTHFERP